MDGKIRTMIPSKGVTHSHGQYDIIFMIKSNGIGLTFNKHIKIIMTDKLGVEPPIF